MKSLRAAASCSRPSSSTGSSVSCESSSSAKNPLPEGSASAASPQTATRSMPQEGEPRLRMYPDRSSTDSARTRRAAYVFIAALCGSIICFSHWLLILRLVLVPQVPSPFAEIAIGVGVALATCLFIRPFTERLFGERFVGTLAWPTFVWMGVSFFLLFSLLASDVVLSLIGAAAWAIGEPSSASAFSARVQAAAVTATALVLSAWGLLLALRPPRL